MEKTPVVPPITLPEGTDYADLNQAHTEGRDIRGRTEEEIHPAAQARIDNAARYRQETRDIESFKDLSAFKSRLTPDTETGTSEFDDRAGNQELKTRLATEAEAKIIGLQFKEVEWLRTFVGDPKTSADYGLHLIENEESGGFITSTQAEELRNLVRDNEAKWLRTFVGDPKTSADYGLHLIENEESGGFITSTQAEALRNLVRDNEAQETSGSPG